MTATPLFVPIGKDGEDTIYQGPDVCYKCGISTLWGNWDPPGTDINGIACIECGCPLECALEHDAQYGPTTEKP